MANALANAMCERCKSGFAPLEKMVNSNGELYHEQCFVCAQCFQQFPEGLFYEVTPPPPRVSCSKTGHFSVRVNRDSANVWCFSCCNDSQADVASGRREQSSRKLSSLHTRTDVSWETGGQRAP